ncbi:hypothetical protein [Nocardioides speluncae]|uniref:phage tail tube protein n=1 Tax=Nocardioides speluncae TaxID=2670337 RepID=UPI000D6999F5|nr:hypothetical protein [Nocardioides speluncae]
MPKMLADANEKLVWVPDGGLANDLVPTPAELNAGTVLDMSCLVTKANYALGATGDESINDPALCASGNSSAPGNTNYEAGMDFFRWTIVAEDDAWTTFTQKGIAGTLVRRIGLPYTTAFAAGQEVGVYGALTGTPFLLVPDANGGFRKFRQNFFIQSELVDERVTLA